MNIMALISALPGAAAQGLIWGIMAIGVYITFRTLDIAVINDKFFFTKHEKKGRCFFAEGSKTVCT